MTSEQAAERAPVSVEPGELYVLFIRLFARLFVPPRDKRQAKSSFVAHQSRTPVAVVDVEANSDHAARGHVASGNGLDGTCTAHAAQGLDSCRWQVIRIHVVLVATVRCRARRRGARRG